MNDSGQGLYQKHYFAFLCVLLLSMYVLICKYVSWPFIVVTKSTGMSPEQMPTEPTPYGVYMTVAWFVLALIYILIRKHVRSSAVEHYQRVVALGFIWAFWFIIIFSICRSFLYDDPYKRQYILCWAVGLIGFGIYFMLRSYYVALNGYASGQQNCREKTSIYFVAVMIFAILIATGVILFLMDKMI